MYSVSFSLDGQQVVIGGDQHEVTVRDEHVWLTGDPSNHLDTCLSPQGIQHPNWRPSSIVRFRGEGVLGEI